ncbi:hypothetical protein L1987_08751 [Smallanthus sonchifolius]|uniref:Uncharacterized protein n=1 Tax=Smallanthus sonchifolius TaxID=185202 RepID=A0ACB9JM31_9ASTR|nr:hypothetical protein L1987_08751 [Smallanthus sonchifolius]
MGEPEKEVSDAKRIKLDEEGNGIGKEKKEGDQKQTKENAKPEPPKDYIHVRGRRGQAADSHSLVERTRASMLNTMNHLDPLAQPFYVMAHDGRGNPLTAMMHRGPNMKSSQIDGFGEASEFWGNDLQSVV